MATHHTIPCGAAHHGCPYEPLWNIDRAAAFLGVCDDTARPLLEHVAAHLTPRTVRYFPADVRSVAEELRGTGPRPAPAAAPALRPEDEPVVATRRRLKRTGAGEVNRAA